MLKCLNVKMTNGFTLMEAIVAIFLITTGIIGVLSLITQTVSSATLSKDRLTAAYLAQEGIEIIRNIRDTNWLEQYTDPTNLWDEGLTACGGACDGTIGNGCRVDYNHSYDPLDPYDPDLPLYTGQVLNIDTTNGFYSYSASTPTKFKRKITITPSGDVLMVCARVEWQEKGVIRQITAQENLYNWK